MKIYHTETQEDYDALMVELERKGVLWIDESLPTKDNCWKIRKEKTAIFLDDGSRIHYNSVLSLKRQCPDIPIIEYKANQNDPVNNPAHYTQGELEVIDILQDKLTPQEFEGFLKGNILKYTFREGIKNGTEDMKKGAWYMARLIEFRKGKGE